jgi:hypothetical protein
VSGLEEVEMVVQGGGVEVVLQHDNVWMVEDLVRVLGPEGIEGGERGDLWLGMSWGVDSGVVITEVMRDRWKTTSTVEEETVRNQATVVPRDVASLLPRRRGWFRLMTRIESVSVTAV